MGIVGCAARRGAARALPRVLAATLVAGLLAPEVTTGAGSPTPPASPLASSSQSFVTVAMGRPPAVADTFWQLLVRAGAGPWRIVTPPGVAANGGLVVAGSAPSGLLSAFVPSQQLRFTPLARSAGTPSPWRAAILPAALAPLPDALAVTPNGGALALVRRDSVEVSSTALGSWHPLVTLRSLRAAPVSARCRLDAFTALAATPAGGVVVGGRCAQAGAVAIIALHNGVWRQLPIVLPSGLATAGIEVLRLRSVTGGLSALMLAAIGARRWLFEARLAPGASGFTSSPALALAPGEVLESTGVLASGGFVVVVAGRDGERAEAFSAAGPPSSLGALPPGTSVVAIGPTGVLEAFVARGGTLTVERRTSAHARFVAAQVLKVPIDYGSSS